MLTLRKRRYFVIEFKYSAAISLYQRCGSLLFKVFIPILWVSVSYITLILRRIQDIIPPDIEDTIALISGDNTGSCESGWLL